jgi:hypothetical protein
MGRIRNLVKTILRETVMDLVPGADLVVDNPPKDHEYRRRRVDAVPPGWSAASAVVAGFEAGRELFRTGRSGAREANEAIIEATVTYDATADDASGRTFVDRLELRGQDWPTVGEQVTLAYDPANPAEFAIVEPQR